MGDGVMNPKHPQWMRFVGRLASAEGCNLQADGTIFCDGSHTHAKRLLPDYDVNVQESVRFFLQRKAFCDCHIVRNLSE
jgi:hypothetical protein